MIREQHQTRVGDVTVLADAVHLTATGALNEGLLEKEPVMVKTSQYIFICMGR